MTELEALVALNMAAGIGSCALARLLEFFPQPQDIFLASQERLIGAGLNPGAALRLCSFKRDELGREFALAKRLGLEIISSKDPDYPENLRNIPAEPLILYVKGKLMPQDKMSVAVVGSRRASFYGLSMSGKFSEGLAGYGLTVISGMAYGIDTCAHKAALKAGGRTIAVLGSGFNHIYPRQNESLCEEIAAQGAVISEFPLDCGPRRENFPRRNRIISGLSLGVLVVEAAKKSGALITADFALEQGREVFALPGKIDSGNSFGTNELIKQGAKLVSSSSEIIEEFAFSGVFPCPAGRDSVVSGPKDLSPSDCTSAETLLYGLISGEPVFLDELLEMSGLDVPQAARSLLNLQLKKKISQLPGQQFIRSLDGE